MESQHQQSQQRNFRSQIVFVTPIPFDLIHALTEALCVGETYFGFLVHAQVSPDFITMIILILRGVDGWA